MRGWGAVKDATFPKPPCPGDCKEVCWALRGGNIWPASKPSPPREELVSLIAISTS